jgi:hypothetical protein
MTFEAIIALVASTGIGASIYAALELAKPWYKVFMGLPTIKMLVDKIKIRYNMGPVAVGQAYDAFIKTIVFVAAYGLAWSFGANGDLRILMGYAVEPSHVGYVMTACVVAFGDLVIDYIEQAKK